MDDTTPDPWSAPPAAAPPSGTPFLPPRAVAPVPAPPALADTPTFPGPVPGLDAPTTSVVVPEPPTRSRKGLVAVLAVIALVAGGVGAFFVFRGDDSPAFALDAAAASSAAAHGLRTHATITTADQTITVDGEVDNDRRIVHVTMDLGAALGGTGGVDAILDSANSAMYLGSDFLAQFGGGLDTKWVKIDKQALEAAGQDASMFDQLGLLGTVTPSAVFEKASTVTDKGFTDVEGEKVKHFEVAVPFAEVIALNPSLQQQVEQLGGALPDELVYDVYVTEGNELRRVTYELNLGPTTMTFDAVQHVLDTAPDIQIPGPADVTDLGDLL